ncbi:TlpA family protein disulfide reductase [Pseudoxanthomonas indica]|uniref:Thiol-disulfide isomerase or thioredoxin n=1 Tax=Pseudoxanthomonas indica TaxID=428993 RepID=A0A1T5JN78_9GAMM|nr:TlpA disulfide reductase family protein [Pseudoxanthomonas indica]GGD43261.1 thioredoxin [Pseudoxanthomonas indica]SKC52732.1 Thiol-disulfide isomerase or thioredoxin [Pseudoxanthomonas indica]
MKAATSVCLVFLVLALAACKPAAPEATPSKLPATTQAKPEPAADGNETGVQIREKTADQPALSVPTVAGKTFDLAEHRGQWVVVNFWATWCGPCLKEMPELSALDAMRQDVQVIGLAYEDIELADMQAFLKEHPVVYPIAIVDVMAPPADFATPRGLPMTYLIAPDGKVAKEFAGPVTASMIEELIADSRAKAAERG